MNDIYKFTSEDAYKFADFIGARYSRKGNELSFRICPYCHADNRDDRNKFSINLETGQFNCFRASCGAHGNMLTLARDFGFKLSDEVERYFNLRNVNARYRSFKDAHRKIEVKEGAVEYLMKRAIPEDICKEYEITTSKDNKDVLVFPFKDEAGELRFIKYRNMIFQKGVTKGSKEWCEKDCMPILFGMNHCTDTEQIVITEGQIDSLSLAAAGIKNAVSVPTGANGFTWVPYCWDFLCKFKKIVVFGDCEKGIITLAEQIKARFPKKTYVVKESDYQGYKDANEILQNVGKDALIQAVENAEFQGKGRLKDMSKVRRVDIEKVETIKTNIKSVDKILTGGWKIGTVNLISGKRGNGKSTLASSFVVEALAQEKNCFIYSGELPDFFVKAWLDRQIVGKAVLQNSDIDKCEQWYGNRLFIYDNNLFEEDGEELEGLIETMEEAIVQKDCKVLLLDNLMTALEECSTNEQLYMAQSNFLGKLAKMAKKFEVIILLVAHPRKSINAQFTNDDVSGSADITNKVDVVMSYDRVGDKKDPDAERDDVRVLRITKNRLTGKLGQIKLYFSDDSKRINDEEDFIRYYLPGSDEFMHIEEEDIPFE